MAALGRALIARIESSIIPSLPTTVREMWFHDAGKGKSRGELNKFIVFVLS